MKPRTEEPSPELSEEETTEDKPLTFLQVLSSTLAAAFGVQSSANRKRDFTRGKASHFILMGIGFTVIFVLVMVAIVNLVLSQV